MYKRKCLLTSRVRKSTAMAMDAIVRRGVSIGEG